MKAIYKTKGKAEEYCELAVNIYNGCTNGCTYCFAPDVKKIDRDNFYNNATPRKDIVKAVVEQMNSGVYKDKMIQLCFTCDPYPTGVDTSTTREIIKAIKDGGGHVQILTKNPSSIKRDLDLLDKNDSVGSTISGADNKVEPNSENTNSRIEALRCIKDTVGCEIWVSCEPVYNVNIIYGIIENMDFIDKFKVGKTNYVDSGIDWKNFGNTVVRIAEKNNRELLLKNSLVKEMMK